MTAEQKIACDALHWLPASVYHRSAPDEDRETVQRIADAISAYANQRAAEARGEELEGLLAWCESSDTSIEAEIRGRLAALRGEGKK